MKSSRPVTQLTLLTVLMSAVFLSASLAAATGHTTVRSLQAVVHGVPYNIKPAQPIPVKPGETFTLTLTGTTVDSAGKVTKGVAIDATFTVHVGNGRITLSKPTANGVDVTVHKVGRHGAQLKYTVTPGSGFTFRRGLASGYINLH